MKRQPELEQIHRLSVKTLDQVFIVRAQEGLGCSLFEAQALTELVKDVYFSWLLRPFGKAQGRLRSGQVSQPEAIQAGRLQRHSVKRTAAPSHPPSSARALPLPVAR
jgi:hypothetical protein